MLSSWSFLSNTVLDLLCATLIYLGKARSNILYFSVPHKILLEVKALKIVVHFYHMQRFSLYVFQHYNSIIDLCEKFSVFFYKNTLLWEAFNQNACQGPENTTRCSHSRVIRWALVALTGLTWSSHQTICPFRLCLQSQPGLCFCVTCLQCWSHGVWIS